MLGVSLQRKPPGEVELNSTLWLTGTVATVVEKGRVIPPSVERATMTLLGTLVITPQQRPLCHASTTVPLGSIAAEGYSLWLVLSWNSLPATAATKGDQVSPPSEVPRSPTVLKLPEPAGSNRATVT